MAATDEIDDVPQATSERQSIVNRRIGCVVAGAYRITRHIGSGASSHVFEAEHERLGKPFAVKLLRPELDTGQRTAQRFRREARAIARLHDEHIVSVIDCGELDDHTPYLVMELLLGEDLRSLLTREGRLPARRAIQIVFDACLGLSKVHAAGLVHRDLKPENLFVTKHAGGEDWCKVLDFGVAKMDASLSTAEGAIIGTVRYMAPEQLTDGSSVVPATDIYAVGAILYECLAGRPPHSGTSVQELMYKVINEEAAPLTRERPDLPASLVKLVSACLSREPRRRPRSAVVLAEKLRESLRDSATPTSPIYTLPEGSEPGEARLPALARRGKVFVYLGSGLALTAMILILRSRFSSGAPELEEHSSVEQGQLAEPQRALAAPPAPRVTPMPVDSAPAFDRTVVPTKPAALASAAPTSRAPRPTVHPALSHETKSPPTASTGKRPVSGFDSVNPYTE